MPLSGPFDTPAIESLHDTIKQANIQSEKQTRTMLWLTWVMAALTVATTVLAGAQVYLAWVALTRPV